MLFTRFRLHYVAVFVLAGVVGCGAESPSSYTVPKATDRGNSGGGGAQAGDYRILGAMYPADSPEWFFKLSGRTEDLNAYEADFDKMLASVSLPAGGGPPDFTAPEGWKRGPGRAGIVVATIRTPDGKFEVTVTSSTGGIEANLKRWSVDQLGNATFGKDDVPKVTKTVDAKGVKGLRADVRGPRNPSGKGPMMGGK